MINLATIGKRLDDLERKVMTLEHENQALKKKIELMERNVLTVDDKQGIIDAAAAKAFVMS